MTTPSDCTWELRELRPALLDDWLAFFDGPAFADNPEWGTCYCRCFLLDGDVAAWDRACASGENRPAMIEKIRAGHLQGVLAYRGGKPVGWVHYGPRRAFEKRHRAIRMLPAPDAATVASVVCFVVAAPERRRGLARRLLEAAGAAAARQGYSTLEGYPPKPAPGHDCAAEHFPGPRRLYDAAGFQPFHELPHCTVMRKEIG